MAVEGYPEMMEKANEQTAAAESESAEESAEVAVAIDEQVEAGEEADHGMMRIMILKDLDEPLIDEAGDEIELLEGDVHNCEASFAESLIAAGIAEAAPL